jgi:hypothetical protein
VHNSVVIFTKSENACGLSIYIFEATDPRNLPRSDAKPTFCLQRSPVLHPAK